MSAFSRPVQRRVVLPGPSSQDKSKEFSSLIDGINTFGFALQQAAMLSKSKSAMAYSNIYHCLLLLVAGAQGESLVSLAETMKFDPANTTKLFESFHKLDIYIQSAPGVEMATAASVWHKPSIVLEQPFKSTMLKTFGSHIGAISADDINAYVHKTTRGKITSNYEQSDLEMLDVMLMSCLYFKASWADPFEKRLTATESFSGFDSETKRCRMMHRVKATAYWEDDELQICFLPYASGAEADRQHPQWQAALILPKGTGKASLESIFSSFVASPAKLEQAKVRSSSSVLLDLSLPRFSFELTVMLNDPLKKIGLEPIFSGSFDFTPLTKSFPLTVTKVVHDIFVQVNEEGTEVAARTVISMRRARIEVLSKTMRLDRPFIFIVFDSVSRLTLCTVVVEEVDSE